MRSADNIVIRAASIEDAEILSAIHRESFPNYWNAEAFTDFFGVTGTFVLVAELENPPPACGGSRVTAASQPGAVPAPHPHLTSPASRGGINIAMIVYRIQHEQADIITIAVCPPHRRRGIARDLLEQAMEKAAALGTKKMFLDVEDGNVAALQLYERYGFTQINRRKLYYRQKDGSFTDALVMMGKLA